MSIKELENEYVKSRLVDLAISRCGEIGMCAGCNGNNEKSFEYSELFGWSYWYNDSDGGTHISSERDFTMVVTL
jgi:hypothetical protein